MFGDEIGGQLKGINMDNIKELKSSYAMMEETEKNNVEDNPENEK